MKKHTHLFLVLLTSLALCTASCNKSGKNGQTNDTQAATELLVEDFNKQVPQKINEDLTLQGYKLEGKTLVCTYLVSPAYLNRMDAAKTRDNLKTGLSQEKNLKLVKYLIADSMSMRYVYNDSTKTLSFDFSTQELSQLTSK